MCGVSCSTRVTVARWAGRAGLFGMLILFRFDRLADSPGKATLTLAFIPPAREGPARCGSGPALVTYGRVTPRGCPGGAGG